LCDVLLALGIFVIDRALNIQAGLRAAVDEVAHIGRANSRRLSPIGLDPDQGQSSFTVRSGKSWCSPWFWALAADAATAAIYASGMLAMLDCPAA
jgi:hypothetical protein